MTLRLCSIASLYNVVGTPNSRTHLLRALLQFAADSKQTDLVYKHFASIDSWLDEWNASSQDRREIYKIVYDQLVAIGKEYVRPRLASPRFGTGGTLAILTCALVVLRHRSDIETFNVLRKHLANFEDADGAALATSRDSAVAAAVQAIRLPDVHQCDDLLELKAVQQLKSDPEHSKLFELLSLFATDKLDAFKTFVAGNPGYLEHIGTPSRSLSLTHFFRQPLISLPVCLCVCVCLSLSLACRLVAHRRSEKDSLALVGDARGREPRAAVLADSHDARHSARRCRGLGRDRHQRRRARGQDERVEASGDCAVRVPLHFLSISQS